jgi:PE-PPE domain
LQQDVKLRGNLPLLDPLRGMPVIGNPLADLIQPDMRVIVDLGYGDGCANVPTPAGLFPQVDPLTVGNELVTGAQQGVTAALVDLGLLPSSDLPNAYPYLPVAETPGEIQPANVLSALSDPSGAASSLVSSPTALPQDLLNLLNESGWTSSSADILGSLATQWDSLLSGLDLSNLLTVPDALGSLAVLG